MRRELNSVNVSVIVPIEQTTTHNIPLINLLPVFVFKVGELHEAGAVSFQVFVEAIHAQLRVLEPEVFRDLFRFGIIAMTFC